MLSPRPACRAFDQAPKAKRAKKEVPIITERDAITRVVRHESGQHFVVISWNVNGFAALHKSSLQVLQDLVDK
jgi:hypothetical protein